MSKRQIARKEKKGKVWKDREREEVRRIKQGKGKERKNYGENYCREEMISLYFNLKKGNMKERKWKGKKEGKNVRSQSEREAKKMFKKQRERK